MINKSLIIELISQYKDADGYSIVNENKHSLSLLYDGIGVFVITDFRSYVDQITMVMNYVSKSIISDTAVCKIRQYIPSWDSDVSSYYVEGCNVCVELSLDLLVLSLEPVYELRIKLQDGWVVDSSVIDVFFENFIK